MKREYAEQIVEKYMKWIYAFVAGRVSNESDVADVTQDICLNLYKGARAQEVYTEEAFVWSIARNTLANYYRGKQKTYYNVSMEQMETEGYEPEDSADTPLENLIRRENADRIQKEIAEYFRIPVGTVKWHLSMARDELKKGMEKMRQVNELKFNPIEFGMVGLSGSSGEMGDPHNYMHSALSQNMVYVMYREGKTVEELADILNVSPVYAESGRLKLVDEEIKGSVTELLIVSENIF